MPAWNLCIGKGIMQVMKTRSAIVVALLAVGAISFAIQDANAVKAAIQKEMVGYVNAMKKRDAKLVEKFILANFSQDFKDTDMRGQTRTRNQTIEAVHANIAMLKSVKSMTLTITAIKVNGNKATTTENMVLDATINGIADPKKSSTLNVNSTWTGTYVKAGTKWLCTSSKTVKEKVMIDGKAFPG